jgi:hypothetical protein
MMCQSFIIGQGPLALYKSRQENACNSVQCRKLAGIRAFSIKFEEHRKEARLMHPIIFAERITMLAMLALNHPLIF